MNKKGKLGLYDKTYVQQIYAWKKEQDMRATELKVAIKTGLAIAALNKKQLASHNKRTALIWKEYLAWCKKKDVMP